MTFSNMVVVGLPTEMKLYVSDFALTFSSKPEAPYSCAMISLEDTMNFTLLRTIKEPLLERELDRLFCELNICYKKNSIIGILIGIGIL